MTWLRAQMSGGWREKFNAKFNALATRFWPSPRFPELDDWDAEASRTRYHAKLQRWNTAVSYKHEAIVGALSAAVGGRLLWQRMRCAGLLASGLAAFLGASASGTLRHFSRWEARVLELDREAMALHRRGVASLAAAAAGPTGSIAVASMSLPALTVVASPSPVEPTTDWSPDEMSSKLAELKAAQLKA